MWTVCWVEWTSATGYRDRWDRCNSKLDVQHLLVENNLTDDPDVLIFGPGANEHIMVPSDFVSE